MSAKRIIKVQWLQRDTQPAAVEQPTAEECLALAAKAESCNQPDLAQYWMDEALKQDAKQEVGT